MIILNALNKPTTLACSINEGLKINYEKYQEYIDACNACMLACDRCTTDCIRDKDAIMMTRCVELGRACATVCGFAARMMWSGSEFAPKACALCAEICLKCVDECSKYEQDHCKVCAGVCQYCADACNRMVANEQYYLMALAEVA